MTASKMHQRDTTRTFGLPGSKSLAGIREALGIPLQEMATSLGLSAAALAIYERHPGWLSAQQLEPFAESYHISLDDFAQLEGISEEDDAQILDLIGHIEAEWVLYIDQLREMVASRHATQASPHTKPDQGPMHR